MATSFEMNLGGMVVTVAQEVATGVCGGTEWRPPVDQMWLQKWAKMGTTIPPHISRSVGYVPEVWSDIASRRSMSRRSWRNFECFRLHPPFPLQLARAIFQRSRREAYPGNEEHRKALPGRTRERQRQLYDPGGEIHALLGENGAGKSTLMQILYGFHAMDSGEMFIDGERVRLGSSRCHRAGIGMVHQEFMLVRFVFSGREHRPWVREGSGALLDFSRPRKDSDFERSSRARARSGRRGRIAAHWGQQRVRDSETSVSERATPDLDEPTAVLTRAKRTSYSTSCADSERMALGRDRYAQARGDHGNCGSRHGHAATGQVVATQEIVLRRSRS